MSMLPSFECGLEIGGELLLTSLAEPSKMALAAKTRQLLANGLGVLQAAELFQRFCSWGSSELGAEFFGLFPTGVDLADWLTKLVRIWFWK